MSGIISESKLFSNSSQRKFTDPNVCIGERDSLSQPVDHSAGELFAFEPQPDLQSKFTADHKPKSRLRCSATPPLPWFFHFHDVGDDGGQHRARDQLLGAVPKIPVAGARRVCG